MARYFIELSYDGALFGGFQIQQNKATVQGELEKALETLYRVPIALTGASRTDAGVHAYQNFLHFDTELAILPKHIYNLNAILPNSVVVKGIYQVPDEAHSRFDAIKRAYIYRLHTQKNPFSEGRSWYYPFPINLDLMQEAADSLLTYTDFESFSKKNTTVNTFQCTITKAQWTRSGTDIQFEIHSNRFLRGMIRGLVGTMMQVGRGQISIANWHEIVASNDEQRVDFSTPAYGLYLSEINYPNFLKKIK
ncbi:MAG: tRNA pseudouridine(38-40) synthase TruA [Sediminibacterium sp.]|nr:tRNA pseudouridine(38-40) synthase TruA [Sediminibacterium sp.]MBP6144134.1 tRNA pseudouridine(38-40) synthase TruA [Sediminibacterium sp.]